MLLIALIEMPKPPTKKPHAKVRIHGHGRASAKQQVVSRIRQRTLDRLDHAVEGPRYLAIDYVLARGLDVIEAQSEVSEIHATDLDEGQGPSESEYNSEHH